jgi:tRNA threonylcarbamoyladenosine biosynthesis protein TsaB
VTDVPPAEVEARADAALAPRAGWSSEGVYLALETSGPLGSVAVARGRDVLARAFLPRAQEQARRILPAVEQVLEQSGLGAESLSGVVVGAGPGSFTGLRIAAATAKGLAHALGLPMWSFSSLAAAALAERALPRDLAIEGWWQDDPDHGNDPRRYVLFDARGERVYAACHEVGRDGALSTLVPPHATSITQLLDGSVPEHAVFCGEGAVRHEQRIRGAGYRVLGAPAGVPTADGLLRMLADGHRSAPADGAGWEPEYLKASSAERETGAL